MVRARVRRASIHAAMGEAHPEVLEGPRQCGIYVVYDADGEMDAGMVDVAVLLCLWVYVHQCC